MAARIDRLNRSEPLLAEKGHETEGRPLYLNMGFQPTNEMTLKLK